MSELRDTELRDLLDRVSAIDGEVDVDEHWVAGRRRRTRRGAGIAVLTGVALVAAAGAVAQTGLLGGSQETPTGPAAPTGPADPTGSAEPTGSADPTGPVAVAGDLETFVFAPTNPTGTLDETQELTVPAAEDLVGTQWLLQGQMWESTAVSSDLVGSTAPTVLTFADATAGGGWAVTIDGCGLAQVPALQLDAQGRFGSTVPLSSDLGCADDVQAAEEFWKDVLSGGGQFSLVQDGQWLLLSVETPAEDGTPTPTDGPTPAPTTEPDEDEGASDDGTTAPGDGTPAPTEDDTAGPSTDPSAPSAGPGDPAAPPVGPFVDPGQESVDQPWPGGGGELFAPTLRAGVHEGFDRVVVDLTGTGDLGWRASYTTDPRLDGSGLPSDIAGESVLELSLTGMAYPEPGSDTYSEGIFGLDTHALGAVVEVQRTAPFEGMLKVFVGMQGDPRPYRVFLLEDPMRLVIDVQTAP